jgi:cell division GTPase FtsZ
MNEFDDFELQLLSEMLDTLIVFDDSTYCSVDNLESIKEKIDFELTIRGY